MKQYEYQHQINSFIDIMESLFLKLFKKLDTHVVDVINIVGIMMYLENILL